MLDKVSLPKLTRNIKIQTLVRQQGLFLIIFLQNQDYTNRKFRNIN